MRFSEQLRQAAAEVWQAQHEHPFIRGIADGTVDPDQFRFYMRQGYLFLIDYGRLLALACARAPRLELMERFAELAHSTLRSEMQLHRAYAAEWGISLEQLEAERPQAATRAYTDFLLRTAALGDFAELVAALLPCMWGYSELGQRLAQQPRPPEQRYERWIEMYSGEEFAALAGWCREVCDEAAAGVGEHGRQRMREAFLASSRHELDFWEQASGHTHEPVASTRPAARLSVLVEHRAKPRRALLAERKAEAPPGSRDVPGPAQSRQCRRAARGRLLRKEVAARRECRWSSQARASPITAAFVAEGTVASLRADPWQCCFRRRAIV